MNEIDKLKHNLEKRGYVVKKFENSEEVRVYLQNSVVNQTIGFSGSMTLRTLRLYELLKKQNVVYWHWENGNQDRVAAMQADIYFTSVNGISVSGEIVNIDGTGNRIAATFFGPKKVVYIVGKNKIAPNCEAAVWRAINIACPKNAQRAKANTPCAVKGDRCYQCDCPGRICWGMAILWGPMYSGVTGRETEVILVNEDLGF